MLSKVYLDYVYRDSLERLAIREGIVHRESEHFNFDKVIHYKRHSERINHKNKILRLLILFDSIDTDFSGYDWSKFVDEGLIKADSKFCNIEATYPKSSKESDFYKKTAIQLLSESKKDFVRFHIRKSPPGYYSGKRSYISNLSDIARSPYYYPQHLGRLTEKDLIDAFDETLTNIVKKDAVDDEDLSSYAFKAFAEELQLTKWNFEDCLYMSSQQNCSFTSPLCRTQSTSVTDETEIVDHLYYLVKTRLTNETLILPQPESLVDVFKIRSDPAMSRFREVLFEWCSTLIKGEALAEQKIRHDLISANKSLKGVYKWRAYQQSPFNFWLNAIGGHIPIFSDILNATTTIGTLATNYKEKRSRWVILTQK